MSQTTFEGRNVAILENMLGAHNPILPPESRVEELLIQLLEQGGTSGDALPVGSIISFMGVTPPAKYLACDGSTYAITDFPILAEVLEKIDAATRATWGGADWTTTFNVPDLRGEFLRGTGTATRDTGTGAAVGAHQDGSLHNSINIDGNGNLNYRIGTNTIPIDKRPDTTGEAKLGYAYDYAAGTSTASPGEYEQYTSRPTNTAVLYCIKAE